MTMTPNPNQVSEQNADIINLCAAANETRACLDALDLRIDGVIHSLQVTHTRLVARIKAIESLHPGGKHIPPQQAWHEAAVEQSAAREGEVALVHSPMAGLYEVEFRHRRMTPEEFAELLLQPPTPSPAGGRERGGLMPNLKPPSEYLKHWLDVRKQSPAVGPLQIQRKQNAHPETRGGYWGWYELFPLDVAVGYWSDTGRDDARGFDIAAWNSDAKSVCEHPAPDVSPSPLSVTSAGHRQGPEPGVAAGNAGLDRRDSSTAVGEAAYRAHVGEVLAADPDNRAFYQDASPSSVRERAEKKAAAMVRPSKPGHIEIGPHDDEKCGWQVDSGLPIWKDEYTLRWFRETIADALISFSEAENLQLRGEVERLNDETGELAATLCDVLEKRDSLQVQLDEARKVIDEQIEIIDRWELYILRVMSSEELTAELCAVGITEEAQNRAWERVKALLDQRRQAPEPKGAQT